MITIHMHIFCQLCRTESFLVFSPSRQSFWWRLYEAREKSVQRRNELVKQVLVMVSKTVTLNIYIKSTALSVAKPVLRITFFEHAPGTWEVVPAKDSSFKEERRRKLEWLAADEAQYADSDTK